MSKVSELAEVLDADVLVIGGGFAGTWAALRARDFVDKVILVEKAEVASSGCSTFASGVQLCPTLGDDLDLWKKEIVQSSEFFSDQEWVDIFLNCQIDRVEDYKRWSAPIERDEKGNFARVVGRGHVSTRLFQFHGPKLMELLRHQILNKKVTLVEQTMIIDLLTSDGLHPTKGRVIGAIGFDTRSGQFRCFQAKAVVMTAGPISARMGHPVDNCSGDGVAAAFRAGTEITNMEFCFGGNITAFNHRGAMGRKATGGGGINMIQGHGAIFLNDRGERFMKKYDPLLLERALPYKLCMAFCKEALEDKGPISVDMRHFSLATLDKFRRVIPRTMRAWDSSGIDLTKEMLEISPTSSVRSPSGEGGIKIDIKCQTNILGLYAAGAVVRNPVQGIYALGGVATASANVLGYIAGENAAKEALKVSLVAIRPEQVENLKIFALLPLRVKDGPEPFAFWRRLGEVIAPAQFNLFKNESRIKIVLSKITEISEDLSKMAATDYHELTKTNEFKNYLLCTEMAYRAALERKESRQYHYREEYPYRDDGEWLKLIVIGREENDGLRIYHEPIPIDKWPIRPEKRDKILHPIHHTFLE